MSSYRDHLYTPHDSMNESLAIPAIMAAGAAWGIAGMHHKRKMAELELEREKLGLKNRGEKFDDADIPNEYFGLPKARRKKDHLYRAKKGK